MSYQNQLPVPVSPPNPQAFIHGLPQNCPFVPNIALSPMMQPMLPMITALALLVLQNNAGRNELRSFHFNLVSRNGYQNPDLDAYIVAVAELAELFINTRRMNPEQAVGQAAETMAAIMVALTAQTYQQALGQLLMPYANDLNASIQQFNQIKQEIQRYHANVQQQQMRGHQMHTYGNNPAAMAHGHRPAAPAASYGGYRPGPAGWNPGPSVNPGHMAHRNAGPVTDMWGTNRGGFDNSRPGDHIGSGLRPRVKRHGVQNAPDVEELTMTPQGDTTVNQWDHGQLPSGHRGSRATPTMRIAPRPDVIAPAANVFRAPPSTTGSIFTTETSSGSFPEEQPTHVSVVPTQEWPKTANPLRPFDSILLEDGSEIRPAHVSGWSKTFNENEPYHLVYDAAKFMLFHMRKPDGTVVETLKTRTPEMGYLENELDPKLRAAVAKQATKTEQVDPNWAMVAKLRPHPLQPAAITTVVSVPATEAEAEAEGDIPAELTPRVIENVFQAHSLKEAEIKLTVASRADASLRSEDGAIEYYFDEIFPLSTPTYLADVLNQMADTTSYEELLAQLLAAKDELPADVHEMIDTRMTKALNSALVKNMGMEGWAIDSFVGDYEDLIEALKSKFSQRVVDILRENAPDLINAALSVLTGDDLSTYEASVGMDSTAPADRDAGEGPFLLCFRNRTSITRVPWKRSDLTLDLSQPGAVPQSTLPELHKAVDSIFDRTLDMPVTYTHRFIQTADKCLLEVRRGYFGKDCFIVSEG